MKQNSWILLSTERKKKKTSKTWWDDGLRVRAKKANVNKLIPISLMQYFSQVQEP